MVCSDVEIGKRIATLRKDAGLTQNALAEAIGLSRTILAKIETGNQALKPDQLYSVAKVLKVTSDELLSGVAAENVAISDDLGLSQGAIEALKFLKTSSVGNGILSAVNTLLESDEGQEMLDTINKYFTVDFSSATYNLSVTKFAADGEMLRTDYNVPHPIERLHFGDDSGKGIDISVGLLRFAMLEAVKNSLDKIRKHVRDGGEK